ncbi:protease [Paenibacillus sp. DXFW5]|uniref:Protease n=1 Tax=Paenibacillus rhizolycopersici TaxID=2780073 RepID=A0ABS2HB41_9BACL|nr:protease [Paenibacillus rhizolycopersici]MBM6997041.1 protease [Paenibacillus rhizolycopersici]
MEALFWGCFVGGALFAVISALLGDLLGSWLDGVFDFLSVDFLKPIITASAITSFGGAGILLHRYTGLGGAGVVVLAIVAAVLLSAAVYFAYVRPMENSENSTGFSESELPGKVGEVTVPIPAQGYGEVMVKLVGGNTLHIASSWDRKEIPAGTVVVVIETAKDGTVQVSELYPHPM